MKTFHQLFLLFFLMALYACESNKLKVLISSNGFEKSKLDFSIKIDSDKKNLSVTHSDISPSFETYYFDHNGSSELILEIVNREYNINVIDTLNFEPSKMLLIEFQIKNRKSNVSYALMDENVQLE